MSPILEKILVVGGNGFLGSAVCRRAVSKGMAVTSISSSGKPYSTPKGHTPAWVNKVEWHAASALDPPSYAHLLRQKTAVVHTMGILLEGGYKDAVRTGDTAGLADAFARAWGLNANSNPLAKGSSNIPGEYEVMNRDSALRILETYLEADEDPTYPRTFVYVSAEDIFRPFVPKRYIDTKREAEREIAWLCDKNSPKLVRDIAVRPGLMYHPHLRPMSTPLAALLDISANFHRSPPFNLPLPLPADVLRILASHLPPTHHAEEQSWRRPPPPPRATITSSQDEGEGEEEPDWMSGDYAGSSTHVPPSSLLSLANLLEIPPIHVDQVADAIIEAIRTPEIRGPVGVEGMRELIGWRWGDDGDPPEEGATLPSEAQFESTDGTIELRSPEAQEGNAARVEFQA